MSRGRAQRDGSAGRRRKSRQSSQAAKQARRYGREPETELDRLLDDPNGLATADPLMAEMAASAVIGSWREYGSHGETQEGFVTAVISGFAQTGKRNQLAILHAMEPMLYPKVAKEARAAIEAVQARGVADPPWAATVGRPAFIEAWARPDDFGDVTLISVNFQHDGWPPHTIDLAHDHNFGELIRGARVSKGGISVPEAWSDTATSPPKQLDAQEVANLVSRGVLGVEYPDLWPDVEIDEEVPPIAPLLRARLKVLPAARWPRATYLTRPERRVLVREFIDEGWPGETASARLRSPRLRVARQVAGALIDFGADHGPAEPLRCTPATVGECLLHVLPIEAGPNADANSVLGTLRRWIRFTGGRTGRTGVLTARLLALVEELEPSYRRITEVEASAAVALASAMRTEDIDPTDVAAVGEWIDRFNRLPKARRDRILGPLP